MRIEPRILWRGLLAAALSTVLGSAYAAGHIYVPFTLANSAETLASSLWLADTDNLGNPPFQLSNQPLDGEFNSTGTNVAILDDWTYNITTHLATKVTPQLVVYGVAGKLYKANLRTIGPVQQFSSASYGELCTLTSLDERPYAATKAYVEALVEPVGSSNTCASGVGIQTWLIPANANDTVAPIVEPTNWRVLGAFTDPTDDSFVRWIVWTGNAVAAYKANFTISSTLLVGPPTGVAPTLISRVNGDAYIVSSNDNGTTHTDTFYHVSMTGSGAVATYSYADTSPCDFAGNTNVLTTAMPDPTNGILLYAEPSNTGYGVYSVPLGGGTPTPIYADASGSKCGNIAGDATSTGYVGVNESNNSTGSENALGVNETGPVTQTPVLLAGGSPMVSAAVRYTANGHFWVTVEDFSTHPVNLNVLVIDGNGTVQQNYANSRISDSLWNGFSVPGYTPGLERAMVYLFSPTGGIGSCLGGSFSAVDPVAFGNTPITGLPADTCNVLVAGWTPAGIGSVIEPAGASPIEADPASGKVYLLLGPDTTGGLFLNPETLQGYPFY